MHPAAEQVPSDAAISIVLMRSNDSVEGAPSSSVGEDVVCRRPSIQSPGMSGLAALTLSVSESLPRATLQRRPAGNDRPLQTCASTGSSLPDDRHTLGIMMVFSPQYTPPLTNPCK
jgi:hypothetical protein